MARGKTHYDTSLGMTDAPIDPRLLALRAKRDALLLKSRTVKNTAAWRAEYHATTDALNRLAADLRRERAAHYTRRARREPRLF